MSQAQMSQTHMSQAQMSQIQCKWLMFIEINTMLIPTTRSWILTPYTCKSRLAQGFLCNTLIQGVGTTRPLAISTLLNSAPFGTLRPLAFWTLRPLLGMLRPLALKRFGPFNLFFIYHDLLIRQKILSRFFFLLRLIYSNKTTYKFRRNSAL